MTKIINHDLIDTQAGHRKAIIQTYLSNTLDKAIEHCQRLNKDLKVERYIIVTLNHYEP